MSNQTTQAQHPWRATVRTIAAIVMSLLPLMPAIVSELGVEAIPWVVSLVAVAGAVTRVLALPVVQDWLEDHKSLAWLAARPAQNVAGGSTGGSRGSAPRHGLVERVRRPRDRRLLVLVMVGALVASLVPMAAVALSPTPQIACAPGVDLIVHPGGTWTCGQPAATPSPSTSSSASASPSPSASASPSASPSSSPTPSPSTTTAAPLPTPSPSTSSTAPGAVLTGCMVRLAECGYPHPGNTGVPAGTALTVRHGAWHVYTAGTVIDGYDIRGCVAVFASDVVIRNSRITCSTAGELAGIYADDAPADARLTVERVEIDCVTGADNRHGIWGHGMRVSAVHIHDCENAIEVNANSVIEDSYLSAREGDNDAHGDVIQSQGGGNVVIRGNVLAGYNPITSSIITNPTQNHGWLVEGNFMSGGAYTLYCPEQGRNFVVSGNRFYGPVGGWGADPYRPAYGFTDACGHSGITWSGNYRDDTLGAVPR